MELKIPLPPGGFLKMTDTAEISRFFKLDALNHLNKFKEKNLCRSHFLNKAGDFQPEASLKDCLYLTYFSIKLAKILRPTFLQNTFRRLLLYNSKLHNNLVLPYEGLLDSIGLRMLGRVDYMKEYNILAESHVQS